MNEANPAQAFAHFEAGGALWFREEFGEAIAEFDEAILLDPRDFRYFLFRGLS